MKRDMELIREILLKIETLPGLGAGFYQLSDSSFEVNGWNWNEVRYHIRLLHTGGFLETRQHCFQLIGLSWLGTDFIDSIRDDEVWSKTLEAANGVGGFTLDLFKDFAVGFIKTKVKNHTGVDF